MAELRDPTCRQTAALAVAYARDAQLRARAAREHADVLRHRVLEAEHSASEAAARADRLDVIADAAKAAANFHTNANSNEVDRA